MASPAAAFLCALAALALWAAPGLVVARRLPVGHGLGMTAAPVLGWGIGIVAAHGAAALFGFTPLTVIASTSAVAVIALIARPAPAPGVAPPALPPWIVIAAAIVAAGPAAAVLPKISAAGVALADPLYDHAKLALVDEMLRTGVPPANPFAGGSDGTVAYYYYWLFGAAELARVTGASGWEADAAATWFTGFASLSLMCGLAFRLAGARVAAPAFVLAAVCGGSLRPLIVAVFGQHRVDAVLERGSGLAGWLFQTTWAPHHVAAAAAVVVVLLLVEQLALAPSAAVVVVIAVLVAAAFGSSLWVGGITFVLCAGAATAVLLLAAKPGRRLPLVATLAAAGCVAAALVWPLLAAQSQAAIARGGGAPVVIAPFPVLSPAVPAAWRGWLDVPAYWLILLPIEFPAAWILGAVAAVRFGSPPLLPRFLPAAAFASLCAGWLLVSTAGENNDLGWRAVLPGVIILTAFAGAGFARLVAAASARRRIRAAAAGVALAVLAWPDGAALLRGNVAGRLSGDGPRFADAPALWAAVRRLTATTERVASNPRLLADVTPWPINASWALLAGRRSCFAGEELALAFTTWPPARRAAAAALFDRVFAGTGTAADREALVADFGCGVVVLTPQDGAWSRDPFATDPRFVLLEDDSGRWRIYRAARPQ